MYKILYADDDTDDRSFLSESVSISGLPANLVYVSDGEEAIGYLESNKKEELPSLIVLDLNMPRRDGKQTLSFLKTHPRFSEIPVIILSTSTNKADKEYCTGNGAVSYFVKPQHFKGYQDLVKNFLPYLR